MAYSQTFVAEMQGLYGPFTVAERVLQRIWLQRDFSASRAALTDGRAVEVISPGRWNLLGGPDFKDAQVRLGDQILVGDVEVHFHAGDWMAHRHRENPAYAHVVLHVLLFPPEPGTPVPRRSDGKEIPALVLLPLLHRDLEEYAADDALEAITARDDWRRLEELAALPLEQRNGELRARAAARWERKVAYARQRVARLGWDDAVHFTALEILGYRHNRVPMLMAAERWSRGAWARPETMQAALAEVPGWQRQGVRPANLPVVRLAQYHTWVSRMPDWPARLAEWSAGPEIEGLSSAEPSHSARRRVGLLRLREGFEERVGRAVGGNRLDTLVCDGFLPLLAAREERRQLGALWFHWFPGDLPDQIRRALPKLGLTGTREQPLCHGFGQGLLAWMIEREFCT